MLVYRRWCAIDDIDIVRSVVDLRHLLCYQFVIIFAIQSDIRYSKILFDKIPFAVTLSFAAHCGMLQRYNTVCEERSVIRVLLWLLEDKP